jgi:pilus assembly protein Flp/PilA
MESGGLSSNIFFSLDEGVVAMAKHINRFLAGEEAATMVEYAMMLALIGAALVTALTSLRTAVGDKFTSVSTTLSGS